MKILLITINYQDVNPTKKLIKSIQECESVDGVKIVIGDNKSKSQTKKDLTKIRNNSN